MTRTLDTWLRYVNPQLPARVVPFEQRTGAADWSGWSARPDRPDAPTLLLLHGTGGARHSWAPVLAALRPDIRVIAPDLPGHGDTRCTAHSRHGLDDMAEDLLGLLAAQGVGRVDLVAGHSAGAAVAIWLALKAPQALHIRQVLGIAPSLVPPPPLYTLMLGPLLAPLVGSGLSVHAAAGLARSTPMVERLIDSTGSQIAPEQRRTYRELLGDPQRLKGAIDFMTATDLPGLLDRLPGLQTPCHFLVADDDRWIPAPALTRIIERYLPGASVRHCDGGHLTPESRPQAVASLIESLIA